MKLIVAVINNDDCPAVLNGLTQKGYSATRLSTSGSFLRAGNSTLMIGTEEEKVDEVIDIISEFSRKRTQMVSSSPSFMSEGFISRAVEVTVGGATVFVTTATIPQVHSAALSISCSHFLPTPKVRGNHIPGTPSEYEDVIFLLIE